MAETALYVPLAIKAKKPEDLSRKLLEVQAKQGGKVSIVSIYWDPSTSEHILWYLPLKSLGGGIM